MIVIGIRIGSGIFIVSADMVHQIGSPGWLLVDWVVTGALTAAAGALVRRTGRGWRSCWRACRSITCSCYAVPEAKAPEVELRATVVGPIRKRSNAGRRRSLSIHVVGVIGLVLVFVIGTLRPINLGALALAMTFLVGTIFAGEGVKEIYGGFPVDLLVLLAGVTYLFAIAESNGTVGRVVEGAARLVKDRRALIPWMVFVVAALRSAGVALLAPLALRLGERYKGDRRMVGLMVVHGAAAGNFSPLNVLGAIVTQALARNGLQLSVAALFLGNLAYNVALAVVIFAAFGGLRLNWRTARPVQPVPTDEPAE